MSLFVIKVFNSLHSDVTRELDTSCILNVPASKQFSAGRDDSGAMASSLESGWPAFNAFFTRQTLRSESFGQFKE